MKKEYIIDGDNFSNLQEFFEEVSNVLIPEAKWGRNLDAFNDILYGGFGTPEEGFIIRWKNSKRSSERLGFDTTLEWLHRKLESCHTSNKESVQNDIDCAQRGEGPTLFDILVEIINEHASTGEQSEDGVELYLE